MMHPPTSGEQVACGAIEPALEFSCFCTDLGKFDFGGFLGLCFLPLVARIVFLNQLPRNAFTALKKYAAKKHRGYKSLKLFVHDRPLSL